MYLYRNKVLCYNAALHKHIKHGVHLRGIGRRKAIQQVRELADNYYLCCAYVYGDL